MFSDYSLRQDEQLEYNYILLKQVQFFFGLMLLNYSS